MILNRFFFGAKRTDLHLWLLCQGRVLNVSMINRLLIINWVFDSAIFGSLFSHFWLLHQQLPFPAPRNQRHALMFDTNQNGSADLGSKRRLIQAIIMYLD